MESNQGLELRRLLLYPLNYGDILVFYSLSECDIKPIDNKEMKIINVACPDSIHAKEVDITIKFQKPTRKATRETPTKKCLIMKFFDFLFNKPNDESAVVKTLPPIEQLVKDKLSQTLSEQQKTDKITNLLAALRKEKKIKNLHRAWLLVK